MTLFDSPLAEYPGRAVHDGDALLVAEVRAAAERRDAGEPDDGTS